MTEKVSLSVEPQGRTVNVNEGGEDKQDALKCSLVSFLCRLRETARLMDCPLQRFFAASNEALPR